MGGYGSTVRYALKAVQNFDAIDETAKHQSYFMVQKPRISSK
jgi:hypothetical protein